MGVMAQLLTLLNAQVVTRLAAAGFPALCANADGSAGSILFGPAAAFETYAPPRVILEPIGMQTRVRDINSATTPYNSAERRQELVMRAIASGDLTFMLHCWGVAGTGSPVDDYDQAIALVDCVRASLHHIAPGAYQIEESGKWIAGTNVSSVGRAMSMGLTLYRPILATLLPFDATKQYAPPAVKPAFTETISVTAGGTVVNGVVVGVTETAPC